MMSKFLTALVIGNGLAAIAGWYEAYAHASHTTPTITGMAKALQGHFGHHCHGCMCPVPLKRNRRHAWHTADPA